MRSTAIETRPLHWEDADPSAGRWWISRARDTSARAPCDIFIAEDDMTDALIGLLRVPPQSRYKVLAVVFLSRFDSHAAATSALKANVVEALSPAKNRAGVRGALLQWRAAHAAAILRKNFPALLLGLAGGTLLGLAVAFFALWTNLVGWPIVAAGVVLGAAAGYLLKLTAEVFRGAVAPEPWVRFAVLMLGTVAGAGITAAVALLLFWH